MMKRIAIYVAISTWIFWAGARTQEYFTGSVRIYHNVNDGTPLNRGQASIEINFPSGVTFNRIKLPDGGWYPDGQARWVEVLEDGRHKTWLDKLSFEAE